MRACYIVSVALLVAVAVALAGEHTVKSPQVYIYLRSPPEDGKPNEVICHSTNFHPPKITMQLKADDKVLEDCKESDLTFTRDWTYYKTLHTKIIYQDGVQYKCLVRHNDGEVKTHLLEKLM